MMQLSTTTLLSALQIVNGLIERKHTKAILANVLLRTSDDQLMIVATDTVMEVITYIRPTKQDDAINITIPCRKLYEICRSFPADTNITLHPEPLQHKMLLKSGHSRFTLATLPADEFPLFNRDKQHDDVMFTIPEGALHYLLNRTAFAISTKDVRSYFMGLALLLSPHKVECIAADGHRLVLSYVKNESLPDTSLEALLPRKVVLELIRLLDAESSAPLGVAINPHNIKIMHSNFTLTAKLLITPMPNYHKIIPEPHAAATNSIPSNTLAQSLARVSILVNEQFRSIKWQLDAHKLLLETDNTQQEGAAEELTLDYSGPSITAYFNISYLLDALTHTADEIIHWRLSDLNEGLIIHTIPTTIAGCAALSTHVVMPLLT